MNRTTAQIAWMGAGVTLAVLIGWSHVRLQAKRVAGIAAIERREGAIARLRQENTELRRSLEDGSETQVATKALSGPVPMPPESVRKDAVRIVLELKANRSFMNLGVPQGRLRRSDATPSLFALTLDGRLPTAFGEIFGLSQAQFDSLQETVSVSKRQIDNLVLGGTVVQQDPNGTVRMEVKLGNKTAGLREPVRLAFQQALGNELFTAYDGSDGGFEALWRTFGAQDRTISLTHVLEPRSRYDYKIQYFDGEGHPTASSSGGTTGNDAQMNEKLGPLVKLLPPNF